MTPAELDAKSEEWTGRVESVLSEMIDVTTPDGLHIYFNHTDAREAFMRCLNEFVRHYKACA